MLGAIASLPLSALCNFGVASCVQFFSKPAIEIWPDLPRYWVAKPIDLSTVKTRIFENYYKCYKDFLAE